MAIEEHRRAKLAALITALSPEHGRALREIVLSACGHNYNEVQAHAWGLCSCEENTPCPGWVEIGFRAAEEYEAAVRNAAPREPGGAVGDKAKLDDVLDETAGQMTGLLRNVVVDTEEIKSSHQLDDTDTFVDETDPKYKQ
ncbi:MAG: hypothetical protein JXR83_16420 [Deltaproteobacteria bacterium]|nr:hypothetical protein [Deltaproteobacteria bacterium]